jgi:hypothetical protein
MSWTLAMSESLGCTESALKLVLGQLSGKERFDSQMSFRTRVTTDHRWVREKIAQKCSQTHFLSQLIT